MTIQEAIAAVCARRDLYAEEMISVMRSIMTGETTDAQIGALLMGLRMKGETIDEIVGAASVMRELSQKVDVPQEFLVDTCGTGGDGANIFNVSTASAFVVAAAGGRVATEFTDRKSVVEGKGVDHGGRRIIQKKNIK